MACEVPVVSSDVGGLPEVNIEGVTGFVRPVGDVEGMASVTIDLLSDDLKLETFRKNAFKQARTFDLENILPQYEAFYMKVIEKAKLAKV